VHLTRLALTNYRNYAAQELELAPGNVLLLGENAQGKTNILEAAFLLATGRADRATTDADLIAWEAREEAQPFARVEGKAQRRSGDVAVEVTIVGRPGAQGRLVASKRFKLNGVARRGTDVAGTILAVLFTTDDMELVKGSPGGRRRYLDIMLTQADRAYARALSKYGKVVTQRNALLKRIQEGDAKADELEYWDGELAADAAYIAVERARAVEQIAREARDAHGRLSGEREAFEVAYDARLVDGWPAERLAASEAADAAEAFLAKLRAVRSRDIAAGVTLSGPHRDDLIMTIGGEAAASFASRGQQRTAALALRLAEARLLEGRSGERPLLLLDDVLSELDESRRASVLAAFDADQALITSADPDRFPASFVAESQVWRVAAGVASLIAT